MNLARPGIRARSRRLPPLPDETDDLFCRAFGDWGDWSLAPLAGGILWAPMDLAELDEAIVLKGELPGAQAKDIDVSVRGDRLTISGEKKESRERKDENRD